jgi:hypothetical protein
MYEILFEIGERDPFALDRALRAALGDLIGGSATGPYGAKVYFIAEPTAQQIANAQSVIDAHDPIFIDVDKTLIAADGIGVTTVTVRAPKPGASPVTLDINGQQVAVELTGGIGNIEITAIDPVSIKIEVDNPGNRCAETLTILAVA